MKNLDAEELGSFQVKVGKMLNLGRPY